MKPNVKRNTSSVEDASGPEFEHILPYHDFYRIDEEQAVAYLLSQIHQTSEQSERIAQRARCLVENLRARKSKSFSLENLLKTYQLNSQEGLALMCLAEALLRIPDGATKTQLIRDKIGSVDWRHRSDKDKEKSESFLEKITSLGLATAEHLMHWGLEPKGFVDVLAGMARRLSEPFIRQSVTQAMKMMGHHFVMGETMTAALRRAQAAEKEGYRHSYDMLGESARTKEDAQRYYSAYVQAIEAIGKKKTDGDVFAQPSISIKLSALHPRYTVWQRDRVNRELKPLVLNLAILAKEHGIGLTIDAEESEVLGLSLEIVEFISGHQTLKGWNGFGLAVQAYQKRAPLVMDYLIEMARRHGRRLCIRLVKGAYWDSEIKRTQEKGLKGYPVFTRKVYTDLSYQVCAQKMLKAPDAVYAQFATHNARTLATILEMVTPGVDFEFQRLHGMGEGLYDQIVAEKGLNIPCRVYAPVGKHRDLLAYLVRRLLENGANTSFVHKIQDPSIPLEILTADPLKEAQSYQVIPHPKIPLPVDLWRPDRQNSCGIDFYNPTEIEALHQKMASFVKQTMPWESAPLISGKDFRQTEAVSIVNPALKQQIIGKVWNATPEHAAQAMNVAEKAFEEWSTTSVDIRAQALEKLADLIEFHREELMALLVHEGGKTLSDGISEVREAADFCRYYAMEARRHMGNPVHLPGPTGETNQLTLQGRGIFVCISPWNFPLAIFLGQIAAALGAGNCVIAKPAHQTPLIAYRVVQLAHQAGIPTDVLHYLPGRGGIIGAQLLGDRRTAGVAFTGSTQVAQTIAKILISRENTPIVPLIAETGGINAMIVDSSALPEQVVQDVITSAFQSAGQRCSALRLLFIQQDIAEDVLKMLKGAMAELSVGNPGLLSTDVGPVIDLEARKALQHYEKYLVEKAQLIYKIELTKDHEQGHFIAPQAWEFSSAQDMTEEIFGPILHIVRFKSTELDKVIDAINATGYGLTLGVHSRIEETIRRVQKRARVGNLYVNRSMIGAVVGVQPFGGEGLSGTGPKAGGPYYLNRFVVERTFSQDTTAAGGNASLLADLE